MECLFCEEIESGAENIFWRDESGLFVARWDNFPSTPGHAEIVPTNHVADFNQLSPAQHDRLGRTIFTVSNIIRRASLEDMYEGMLKNPVNETAGNLVMTALQKVREFNRSPDAFNHGLNDGEAAGRTVHHMHYHLMPRWSGDMDYPAGGVRHMFPVGGNYRENHD